MSNGKKAVGFHVYIQSTNKKIVDHGDEVEEYLNSYHVNETVIDEKSARQMAQDGYDQAKRMSKTVACIAQVFPLEWQQKTIRGVSTKFLGKADTPVFDQSFSNDAMFGATNMADLHPDKARRHRDNNGGQSNQGQSDSFDKLDAITNDLKGDDIGTLEPDTAPTKTEPDTPELQGLI